MVDGFYPGYVIYIYRKDTVFPNSTYMPTAPHLEIPWTSPPSQDTLGNALAQRSNGMAYEYLEKGLTQ
jgi:hypothetical protein